jgi:hypothetical protein
MKETWRCLWIKLTSYEMVNSHYRKH